MAERFEAKARRQGDAGIVDITGELDGEAAARLQAAYAEAAGGAERVILNFGGLTYMNSTGIGLLVTLLVRAQRQNQRMLAYGLSEHYRQIFEITRLSDFVTIHADEASAVAGSASA